jgi:hypothetical protein
MIRKYLINPGHTFRMPDGTVLDAGAARRQGDRRA